MADITDVTGAGKLPRSPFDYGTGGVSSPREAFDKVVADYTNKTVATDPLAFAKRMGGQFTQSAPGNGLDEILGMMYETSGGVNYATVRQLEAQKLAAQQNYKTNRADA